MSALDELKALPQWIGWNAEPNGNGKLAKIPKNPRNGKNAASNNPETWSDIGTAWRAVKRNDWTGLGFVFTLRAGYVGVDLDDCFEADGVMKPWAWDIFKMLDSYTEFSPSRKGLHIICRGSIPASINKSTEGVEMYGELRYFTVTGDTWGHEKPIVERTTELGALYWCYADSGPKMQQAPRVYTPGDVDEKKLSEALRHVPTRMDYYDWIKVLMAVHDVFPDRRGIALCEAWSPGYEGEIENKFKSFDRTSKSGVTVATLFHMAKQNGWGPSSSRPRPMTHKQKLERLAAA